MAFSGGRISEFALFKLVAFNTHPCLDSTKVFQVVVGIFFSVALLVAAARIIIRLWLQKRLRFDDYLVLFSCICLIPATGLLYYGTSSIFFVGELCYDPTATLGTGIGEAEIIERITFFQKINWAYLTLTWTSIFAIKFGFLSLFRHLVDRVQFMHTLWKGVTVFTVSIYAFSVCDSFITCPKLGAASLQCTSSEKALNKALALGATAISLDIVTDVFILMIPISLLWRVQIKTRQKLGLATFLCLSICMIIVAIIRVSGLHYRGWFDNSWIFLWQQVESCVAVIMLSLTAFRSVFVAGRSSGNKAQGWVPSTRRLLGRHQKSAFDAQRLDDLTISSATLTGMSRVMGQTEVTPSMDESLTSESWPLTPKNRRGSSVEV